MLQREKAWLSDISISAIISGFVSVLVGFTSAAVIVIQAAQSLGATSDEIASWMWALGLGIGLTSILLSLRYRLPVVTVWSTPGAAMLITSTQGVSMSEATGAFILSAALITLCGFSGWFERLMNRIPLSIGSGMLAGVLLRFGLNVFLAMETRFFMVFTMFFVYLVINRFSPRYAVIVTLLVGMAIAKMQSLLRLETVSIQLASPVFMQPQFSLEALMGVALPLFIVTMASQNLPGIAMLRVSGYSVPISPLIGWTGIATIVLASFGAFAINLAAITAAICIGQEAHEDPSKRYVAAIASGIFYLVAGIFGATVGTLFDAFPQELLLTIAGLALMNTIGNSLAMALMQDQDREPALIVFLVTASGITLWSVGSAFWGLVAGAITMLILRLNPKKSVEDVFRQKQSHRH
ncbi:MAG: benzoate/H(+) symporter BenE family transporter [Cyanobacteria bacterium P01_A01_bin.40]